MSESRRSGLVLGVVLILAGLVFLLNNLGIIPGDVIDWWPLLVVGAGLWMLGQTVRRRGGDGVVGGVVLTTLGTYWLLSNLGLVNDGLFIPLLLIALGAGLLLRGVLRH